MTHAIPIKTKWLEHTNSGREACVLLRPAHLWTSSVQLMLWSRNINGSCCFLHFTYKMKVLTKCMSDATTTDLTWKAAKVPQKSDSSCHMEQQICASSTAQRGTATHHPTLLMQLNAHAFHYEIKPFSYIQMDTLHKFVFNELSQGTAVS